MESDVSLFHKTKKKRPLPRKTDADAFVEGEGEDELDDLAKMQALARAKKLAGKKLKVTQHPQAQHQQQFKVPQLNPSLAMPSSLSSAASAVPAVSSFKSSGIFPPKPLFSNRVWRAPKQGGVNPTDPLEIAKKAERAKRFASSVSAKTASESASSWLEDNEPVSASGGLVRLEAVEGDHRSAKPIIGTCQIVEKEYLRMLDRVNPARVRSPPILRKALDRVKAHWKANEDYTYACSQLKSIRQDCQVQHLVNELSVEVYEIHARIALEAGDLNEFCLCCHRLDDLRARGLPTRAAEFTSYRLLHALYCSNHSVIRSTYLQASPKIRRSHNVLHALEVIKAYATGNHHRFFLLYRSAPDMSAYMMDFLLFRVRRSAIERYIAAYGPSTSLSLTYLAEELGFDDVEECQSFIEKKVGGVVVPKGPAVKLLDIGASRKKLATANAVQC